MTPWVDMGPAEVDNTDARMYQLKNMAGEKVNTYTFYIGKVCWGRGHVGERVVCSKACLLETVNRVLHMEGPCLTD